MSRYPFLLPALLVVSGLAFADEQQPPQHQPQQLPTPSSPETSRVENVDLYFETDSAELGDEKNAELKTLADWVRCDPKNAIILEGHADPPGTRDHNLVLAGERAAAVRQQLIELGVPSNRIVVTIFGERGDGRESDARDRRVTARAVESPVAPEDLSGLSG